MQFGWGLILNSNYIKKGKLNPRFFEIVSIAISFCKKNNKSKRRRHTQGWSYHHRAGQITTGPCHSYVDP